MSITKKEAAEIFASRLNYKLKQDFTSGTFFQPGKKYDWEHAGGTCPQQIEIISFDGNYVKFRRFDGIGDEIVTFTLDNLYLFDRNHLQTVYDNAKEFDYYSLLRESHEILNHQGVYILHQSDADATSGYYVGKATHLLDRLRQHYSAKYPNDMEKLLQNNHPFTVRCIPFRYSGYSSVEALETAFIAFFNSARNPECFNQNIGWHGPKGQYCSQLTDTEIFIYSREQAEKLIQDGNFPQQTAVITFYDPEDSHVDYSSCCGSDDVYYCQLDDLDPDTLKAHGTSLEQYFDYADEVAEFIYDAFRSQKNIICQCDYGQSRSAGCAAAIQEHFYHNGIDIFADYRYYPNQLIYHKIFDALEAYASESK